MSDPIDGGIDLVEFPFLLGLGIGRQRAGAQADDTNPSFGMQGVEDLEDSAHWSGSVEVGQGLPAMLGVEALPAMDRFAVNQLHKSFLRILGDSHHAEKIE